MKKYVPRPPAVSFEETIKHLPTTAPRRPRRPRAKPVERTGKPSKYSLPGFYDNVYARMLAAKPKMDIVTRHLYPSTMLTKVGLTKEDEVGARSPRRIFRGPRVWVSAACSSLPKQVIGRLMSKYTYLHKLKSQQAFCEHARQVLLDDIKELAAEYKAHPPPPERGVVCYLRPQGDGSKIPVVDLSRAAELHELDLPSEIRSSPAGLHLAGFLVKYTFIYNRSQ